MCPGPYKNAPMASGGSFWLLLLFLHWPEFKWAACKKCRIKQSRQGGVERIAGDDDAPSLCIHADDKPDDNEDYDAENWQCGRRDCGGMDGMVVQGGAREWRGKAAR